MVFAFGHIVAAWIAGKVYEFASKRKLSHLAWLFLILGGILPDVDHLIDWTFNTHIHRGITHNLFFAIMSALIVYSILRLLKQENMRPAAAIGCGIFVHIFMDTLSYPGVPLLWPSQLYFSLSSIGYLGASSSTLFTYPLAETRGLLKFAVFDMAIGTAWLAYLALRRRIRF